MCDMDVLSQAIGVMRTGQTHSYHLQGHGRWGWSRDAGRGAGLIVVMQGSCVLVPESGEPLHLGIGDVVLLPSAIAHTLAETTESPAVDQPSGCQPLVALGDPDQPVSTVLLCGQYQLDQARPHPLFGTLPSVVHLPSRLGQHPSLRAAVELLGGELDDSHLGADAAVPALLDVLLLYVLRAWFGQQNCEGGAGWAAALADEALTAGLCAIHGAPEKPWTVASLGKLGGLSRAAFARRFAALVGQPPLAYLTWWRMIVAARLLRESDLSLGAVAVRVGYSSEFAFAAAFKREFGLAPGRYRHGPLPALAS